SEAMMSRVLSVVSVLAALLLCSGCRHDGCEPLASRCDGHVAELCDADRDWIVVADCDEVSRQTGATWVCVTPAPGQVDAGIDGATCLPIDTRPRVSMVSK